MAKIAKNNGFHKVACEPVNIPISPKKRKSLDTLGQLRTNTKKTTTNASNEIGKLTPQTLLSDKKSLIKRARRKYFTRSFILKLVDCANRRSDYTMAKSYWRSYHCCDTVFLDTSGKLTTSYCKCRWCLVCASIRTAVYINKYSSILDSWDDSQFLTLTDVNCRESQLPVVVDNMLSTLRLIFENHRKRRSRNKTDVILVGIRKLECTYNPIKDTYNPHFHIITKDKVTAQIIMSAWLDRQKSASPLAQDIRKTVKGSSAELLKYETKVIYDVGSGRRIYPRSLDWIYSCVKGRRTVSTFGFKSPSVDNILDSSSIALIQDYGKWSHENTDWIMSNGDLLTGYVPSKGTTDLIKKSILPF